MKKKHMFPLKVAFLLLMVMIVLLLASSCNRTVMDTVYNFKGVQIAMPDGTVITGKVEGWLGFSDSDMIQVRIDGVTYLTHSTNVVLHN